MAMAMVRQGQQAGAGAGDRPAASPKSPAHRPTPQHSHSTPQHSQLGTHLQAQVPEGIVLQPQPHAVLGVAGAQSLYCRCHGAQPGVVPAIHKLPAAVRGRHSGGSVATD